MSTPHERGDIITTNSGELVEIVHAFIDHTDTTLATISKYYVLKQPNTYGKYIVLKSSEIP